MWEKTNVEAWELQILTIHSFLQDDIKKTPDKPISQYVWMNIRGGQELLPVKIHLVQVFPSFMGQKMPNIFSTINCFADK